MSQRQKYTHQLLKNVDFEIYKYRFSTSKKLTFTKSKKLKNYFTCDKKTPNETPKNPAAQVIMPNIRVMLKILI